MPRIKEDHGIKTCKKVKATYYHFEPGDGTRYELVIARGVPGGAVLAMTCPYQAAMVLPAHYEEGLNTGYINEKMFNGDGSRFYTAGVVASFLKGMVQ